MSARRALHWVFKIADREKAIKFYMEILGMRGAAARGIRGPGVRPLSNGPYDNKWSKTMIGYDHEDTQFVLETDVQLRRCQAISWEMTCGASTSSLPGAYKRSPRTRGGPVEKETDGALQIKDPDGYAFSIRDGAVDAVSQVSIAVSSLKRSLDLLAATHWDSVFTVKQKIGPFWDLPRDQAKLELIPISEPCCPRHGHRQNRFCLPLERAGS